MRTAGTTRPMPSSSSAGSRKKSANSPALLRAAGQRARCRGGDQLRLAASGEPGRHDVEEQEQAADDHDEGDQPVQQHEELVGCSSAKSNSIERSPVTMSRLPVRPGPTRAGPPARITSASCSRCRRERRLVSLPLIQSTMPLPEGAGADGGGHQVRAVEAEDRLRVLEDLHGELVDRVRRRWRCPASCSPRPSRRSSRGCWRTRRRRGRSARPGPRDGRRTRRRTRRRRAPACPWLGSIAGK